MKSELTLLKGQRAGGFVNSEMRRRLIGFTQRNSKPSPTVMTDGSFTSWNKALNETGLLASQRDWK